MLQLGFVSAILADYSFEQVIDFASDNGFSCVEIMCWPKGKAERRYAGVTHIDVDALDAETIEHIKDYLTKKNVFISGLGYYPNPLDPDPEKSAFYLNHIQKVIKAAKLLDIPVVNTFIGRHPAKTLKDNLALFSELWKPIIALAEQERIKIGIENCPMLFTYDEWPGGKNLAISPSVWQEMFSIFPSDWFGLNFDPSHLIWQQMDYLTPLKDFSSKLFHIHLKDAKVYKDKLDKVGILATPLEYHSPKLPGLGDVNWKKFLTQLKNVGYSGAVVIEFEDKDYESSEELIVKGLLKTHKYISKYL